MKLTVFPYSKPTYTSKEKIIPVRQRGSDRKPTSEATTLSSSQEPEDLSFKQPLPSETLFCGTPVPQWYHSYSKGPCFDHNSKCLLDEAAYCQPR